MLFERFRSSMGRMQEDVFCRICCEGATDVTEDQKVISMHRSEGKKSEKSEKIRS